MMAYNPDRIEDLTILNKISETLNQATDVQSALHSALAQLARLMPAKTGWITLIDHAVRGQVGEEQFTLASHHNLPPGLVPEKREVWEGTCRCQDLCRQGKLTRAYNEIHCSRLEAATGEKRGLTVHASVPLMSGDRKMGILNVAAKDWSSFDARSLSLLTMVGNQIGIAVERAQLFDLLRERRINEQAAVLDFSSQLLGRQGLDAITAHLVKEVQKLLEADACSLLLHEDGDQDLCFAATSGWRSDPSLHKIPLDTSSGPGWVIQHKEPLLIEDLQDTNLTSWAPEWVRVEGFRGHAVFPLVVDERAIGVLVLNNRDPRSLDVDDRRFLQLMANQAAIAIENARLHEEEIVRQRMEDELEIGRKIQLGLLPESNPILPGYEFGVLYQAAQQVGGDFYDYCWVPREDDALGLLIGDVSGKGVPAALFMAMCRTAIRAAALSGRSPAATLIAANTWIEKDNREGYFLSAICAALDTGSGSLLYANAGHNRPLLIRVENGEIEELRARGIILGVMENIEIEEERVDLQGGDAIVFYTDGITEAFNADGDLFGIERLKAVLAANADASAQGLATAVEDALHRFAGSEPQADDFTLVALKRTVSS
jgi:serine phosphatase RsbU (regulator of sigma subunit)